MEKYEIDIKELKKKQANNAKIIDVRSLQEYNERHIKGAINIPYYDMNKNIQNKLVDKNQEIVLYCSYGGRSKTANNRLKSLGYNNVYCLYRGIDFWI